MTPAPTRRTMLALLAFVPLAACGGRSDRAEFASSGGLNTGETPQMRQLIEKYASVYNVPVTLVHRVVQRESGYNAGARNGPYYGLMQILPQTAGTMGYDGPASGLLDAETNLKYAVKYLRGAWMCADGSEDRAVMWYASGYYYEAKRRGILVETGLRAA